MNLSIDLNLRFGQFRFHRIWVIPRFISPVLQVGILVCIAVDGVNGFEEIARRRVVCKALNECSQVLLSTLQGGVLMSSLDRAYGLLSNGIGMSTILLSQVQQSGDSLLIVLMSLDFYNHLFQTEDDLIFALLGKSLTRLVSLEEKMKYNATYLLFRYCLIFC